MTGGAAAMREPTAPERRAPRSCSLGKPQELRSSNSDPIATATQTPSDPQFPSRETSA